MGASTILLAEDDPDQRDTVQEMLEEHGYDVIPARTGKQALDFLALDPHSPPDLVILDLMMPLVTGWQVLDAIRHDPALAKVPVVVVSAVTQDRPNGAAAFLLKPYKMDTLLDTLERLRPSPC